MPALALTAPKTYAELRRSVEAVVHKGRQAIDMAWLRTYHDTGRLIHEFILRKKDRADYGADLFNRLTTDTGIDRRTLQQSVQFYRYFPNWRGRANLGWSHYRALVQVADAPERERLQREAVARHWSSTELEQRIRTLNAAIDVTVHASSTTSGAIPLLTPRRGTPGISKVLATDDGLAVDLGFACFVDLPADTGLAAGALVQFDAAGRARPLADATKADLFTYRATILKLVDGDTLWVKIHVGQRHWLKQKLRLRDLDCPELSTPEGKAARRFVEALLGGATAVTICTTRPDKYDRYLADVYLSLSDGEIYLNNKLLSNGHAVIKREWAFADWGDK